MKRARTAVLIGMVASGLLAGTVTLGAQAGPEQAVVAFQEDVHARAGFTCVACHGPARIPEGGGPGAYASIARTDIAPMCARCHSDAAFMRQYAPQVRVDQHAQYLTSVHGQRMAEGDDRVATCSDCHSAHGILQVSDARSPIAPANTAETCARCHADEAVMAPFGRSTEVFDEWAGSVHAEALLVRGDRSAPTCNTCHGSHGATPPGVDSVANVCAQCHVREADLFRDSIKGAVFDVMGLNDCLVCHNNHAIERPDETWIGVESPAVCAMCHDGTAGAAETIMTFRTGFDELLAQSAAADELLTEAEEAGMLVDDGHLSLGRAREASVQLRVLIHAFDAGPFTETLEDGSAAVAEAHAVGEAALAEMDFRRLGLAVATLFILGFLVTLFVKIRRLPPIEA